MGFKASLFLAIRSGFNTKRPFPTGPSDESYFRALAAEKVPVNSASIRGD
jgi:hypothetical protein